MRLSEPCRGLAAALLVVTLASSAAAQSTRVTRAETDLNDLNRRLPAGSLGSPDELGTRSMLDLNRPVDVSQVDRRVLANLMKEAYDESGRLYNALDADYRRNPQLRSLMTDLLRLRSQTSRLNQDLADNIPLERIVKDFRIIDADWRLFSHRISQATGLSSATLQSVDRLDRLDQQVGKLFQVEPTLDRRAILQQLSILETSMYLLGDELRREANVSDNISQMVSDARKLEQQAGRIQDMVLQNYSYAQIVSDYNRFDTAWVTLMSQLRSVNNPYVERAVRRIMDADTQMHDLLWIEHATSREQLRQIADTLIRDVDEFYNRTPLKLLLSFKNMAETLQIADNFYGTVQNFRDNLNRNEGDERLIEAYNYVEQYGVVFIRTFSTLRSQAALVVLREIEDGIAALRAEMHLGGTTSRVDTRRLLPVAASLENLADQLEFDVRHWLSTERPPYRNEVLTATAAFMKRTQRLHQLMDNEPALQDLQRETDNLYEEWKVVYGYLSRCRTADRQSLSQLASEIRIDLTDLNSLLQM